MSIGIGGIVGGDVVTEIGFGVFVTVGVAVGVDDSDGGEISRISGVKAKVSVAVGNITDVDVIVDVAEAIIDDPSSTTDGFWLSQAINTLVIINKKIKTSKFIERVFTI